MKKKELEEEKKKKVINEEYKENMDDIDKQKAVEKEEILKYFDEKKVTTKNFRKCVKYLNLLPVDIEESLDVIFIKIFSLELTSDEKLLLYQNLFNLVYLMDEPIFLAEKIQEDASSGKIYSFFACKSLFILITEYDFQCPEFLRIFWPNFEKGVVGETVEICDFLIQIVGKIFLFFCEVDKIVIELRKHSLFLSSRKTFYILNTIYFIMTKHTLLYDKLVKSNSFPELDVLKHSFRPIRNLARAIKNRNLHSFELNYDDEVDSILKIDK